jgi:hypothetical protein
MLNARGALEWRERFQQESASPGNQAPLELEQVAAKLVGGSELLPSACRCALLIALTVLSLAGCAATQRARHG